MNDSMVEQGELYVPAASSNCFAHLSSHGYLTDARDELVDPNPDIRVLFLEFNREYFHSRLAGCEVKWSPRMTLCAGQCHYEGRGGLCSIRLSEPLLKYRPRKDLLETLLHEMIHAYLFVTDNNKDHDGHGPEFQSHMHRINSLTGLNISIYHNFHAEVAEHRKHWWRCSGPCKDRPPYFGYVKRATNRVPGPNDLWWEEHTRSCGGQYVKVKEPEGYQSKSVKKAAKDKAVAASSTSSRQIDPKQQRLDVFLGKGHVLGSGIENNKVKEHKADNKVVKANADQNKSHVLVTGASTLEEEALHEHMDNNSDCYVRCPVCSGYVAQATINAHLDMCLV